jgi:4-amino-4-deoxy-L-arabinose transferase-like glycosyltransferase
MGVPGSVNGGMPAAGRWPLLLLAVCGAVLIFWRLGAHDLWPPDEPRFAEVAREMEQRGDYSVLWLNDHLYTDKPPLFFWAINAFGALHGRIDEWAARMPSAVATFLALWLILRLGTRLYDRRTGLLGALVFLTSVQIAIRARWASIDMTLNLLVLGAIVLLWEGGAAGDAGNLRRARLAIRGAWVAMGLATLAKGPVGLLLPLLAVGSFLVLERRWRTLRRLAPLSGLLLYLAVVLSWFGLFAARLGPSTAFAVVTHQTVERYVDAWNARHPVWYYVWRFPAGFFPWILLLPWGIAQALHEGREDGERRRAAIFLLAWIASIFLFFSFSTGKRGVYIIPLYPAAAILVARLLARAAAAGETGREARGRLVVPLRLWTAVGALLCIVLPIAARRRHPELVGPVLVIGLLLLGGGVAALLLRRRGGAAVSTALLGSAVAVILTALLLLVPWTNRHQNLRGFALSVKRHLDPAVPFGTTEQKREAWVFYTGRFAAVLDSRPALLAYLAAAGPRDLLIEDEELRPLRGALPPGVTEVLRGRVGDQDYYLLRKAGP